MTAATASDTDENGDVVRVLIVDDNRDAALTLGILLRSEGYIVRLATTGAEALALLDSFRPDAALLDLHMPERSGFDLASDLQRRYGNECPILIAVTAHAEHRSAAANKGFNHFVPKPYDPQALLELIGRAKKQNG